MRGKTERKKEEGKKEQKERKEESKGRGEKEVKTERELFSVTIHAFISCTNPIECRKLLGTRPHVLVSTMV